MYKVVHIFGRYSQHSKEVGQRYALKTLAMMLYQAVEIESVRNIPKRFYQINGIARVRERLLRNNVRTTDDICKKQF
jgi:hypothetical protein